MILLGKTVEEQLYNAIGSRLKEEFAYLLPIVVKRGQINWKSERKNSFLHVASLFDREEDVDMLAVLMKQPNIDMNATNFSGETPFHTACVCRAKSAIKLLLNDPRVDINKPGRNNVTPLWTAIRHDESLWVLKYILTHSERRLDTDSAFIYDMPVIKALQTYSSPNKETKRIIRLLTA